jgi:hypothetical protein
MIPAPFAPPRPFLSVQFFTNRQVTPYWNRKKAGEKTKKVRFSVQDTELKWIRFRLEKCEALHSHRAMLTLGISLLSLCELFGIEFCLNSWHTREAFHQSAMEELASLDQSTRENALGCFRIIEPCLEQDRSLGSSPERQESRIEPYIDGLVFTVNLVLQD